MEAQWEDHSTYVQQPHLARYFLPSTHSYLQVHTSPEVNHKSQQAWLHKSVYTKLIHAYIVVVAYIN